MGIKSLDELKALRDKLKTDINVRSSGEVTSNIRVVVGMATCGIAAGARPVMAAFSEELETRGVRTATVSMTGCVGVCRYEPMCDLIEPNGQKTTYVKLSPDMARRIVAEHVVNGHPVYEYTIGAAEKKAAE